MYQTGTEISPEKLAFVAGLTKMLDVPQLDGQQQKMQVMRGLHAEATPKDVIAAAAVVQQHPEVLDDVRREYARQRQGAEIGALNARGLRRGTIYLGNNVDVTGKVAKASAEQTVDELFAATLHARANATPPSNDEPLSNTVVPPKATGQSAVANGLWRSAAPTKELVPNGRPLASAVRGGAEISAAKLRLVANLTKIIDAPHIGSEQAKTQILSGLGKDASKASTLTAAVLLRQHPELLSELRDMHARQRVEAEVAILNHDGKKRGTVYLGNDPQETATASRETAERRFDALFAVKAPAVPTSLDVEKTDPTQQPELPSQKSNRTLPNRSVDVNARGPHNANGKLSGAEGDQSKKPEANKKESNAPDSLTVALGQSALEKSPLVPTGSPSGITFEHTLKSALPNWNVKANPGGGWQCSQGGHQLTYDGQSIKGSTGSATEVKGMFEVARANNWPSMAFNGNDAYKTKVIETALKSGYAVTTFNDKDLAIVNAVRKKMEYVKKLGETQSNENPALNAARTNGRAVDLTTQSRNAEIYSKSADSQSGITKETKTAFITTK